MNRAAPIGSGPGAPRLGAARRRLPRGVWFAPARIAALAVIVPYLGISLWFQSRHLCGDSMSHPLAYFFTWDMFPNYGTLSVRRSALGLTEDGRAVRLVPGPAQRFRWGKSHDLVRNDLHGTIDFDPGAAWMRRSATTSLGPVDAGAGPHVGPDRVAARDIATILVLEESWPVKFNLPPDLYEREHGEPRPDRRAVRIATEFPNPLHVPRAARDAAVETATPDRAVRRGATSDAGDRTP